MQVIKIHKTPNLKPHMMDETSLLRGDYRWKDLSHPICNNFGNNFESEIFHRDRSKPVDTIFIRGFKQEYHIVGVHIQRKPVVVEKLYNCIGNIRTNDMLIFLKEKASKPIWLWRTGLVEVEDNIFYFIHIGGLSEHVV